MCYLAPRQDLAASENLIRRLRDLSPAVEPLTLVPDIFERMHDLNACKRGEEPLDPEDLA